MWTPLPPPPPQHGDLPCNSSIALEGVAQLSDERETAAEADPAEITQKKNDLDGWKPKQILKQLP
jgi:hypothetical protein